MEKRMTILLYEGKDSTPLEFFISEFEKEFLFKSDSVT